MVLGTSVVWIVVEDEVLGAALGLAFAGSGAQLSVTCARDETRHEMTQRLAADDLAQPAQQVAAALETGELPARLSSTPDVLLAAIRSNRDGANDDPVTRIWPWLSAMQNCKQQWGSYPRYVICVMGGPDPLAIALQRTLCRYVSAEVPVQEVSVNTVLANAMDHALAAPVASSLRDRFGEAVFISPDEVASACLALTSGRMDAVRGQMLRLTHGLPALEPREGLDSVAELAIPTTGLSRTAKG